MANIESCVTCEWQTFSHVSHVVHIYTVMCHVLYTFIQWQTFSHVSHVERIYTATVGLNHLYTVYKRGDFAVRMDAPYAANISSTNTKAQAGRGSHNCCLLLMVEFEFQTPRTVVTNTQAPAGGGCSYFSRSKFKPQVPASPTHRRQLEGAATNAAYYSCLISKLEPHVLSSSTRRRLLEGAAKSLFAYTGCLMRKAFMAWIQTATTQVMMRHKVSSIMLW